MSNNTCGRCGGTLDHICDSRESATRLAYLVREILFAIDGADVWFRHRNDWTPRAQAELKKIGLQIDSIES
jgi:hypothetical protein